MNINKSPAGRMFRAFSDPTRIRILCLLYSEGELCAGDLVAALRLPQPTVSRHLRTLRLSGLAFCRKKGRWCFYSLASAHSAFHKKLLACLAECFREIPNIKHDLARARRLRRRGGCCPPLPEKKDPPYAKP